MKLALDTNTYRAFMEGDERAVDWIRRADVIGMPVPVLAELRFGFAAGTRGQQNEATLVRFLDSPRIQVLVCDEQTSHFYSDIKHQLKTEGTPIPINDVWIAALVLQHQMTLLSYDRHFDRIPQLPRAR